MKKQFQSKSVPRGTRTIWRYLGALFILFTFAIGNVRAAGTAIASLNFNEPTTLPSAYTYSSTNTPAIATFQSLSCINVSSGGGSTAPTFSGDNSAAPTGGKRWLAFQPAEDCSVTIKVGKANDSRTFYVLDKDHSTTSSSVSSYNPSAKNVWENSWVVNLKGGTWYAIIGSGSNCYIAAMSFVGAAKTDPTVTFNNGAYTVGGSALNLSTLFSSNSDGAVTYTVKTDGGTSASISGTSFTASAAGTAVVTASQAATSTYNAKAVDANIVVSVPSTPTHGITYNNTKGATNPNPDTYYEGTGVASFEPLADVDGFHFTGWSPASIAADASGDKTINATWVPTYNVSFDKGAGGGTVPAGFQKWEGATFDLPGQGDMTAPSGRVFGGWKVGVSDKYAAGDTYTMGTTSVEFVAQWDVLVEQVIYSWEGAEGGATEVGGTVAGSADGLINQLSAGYYCLKIDGNNSYSGNLVTITLSGEEKVKTGDKITYWGFYNKSSSANARPKMRDANSPNAQIFDDPNNLPNLNGGGDPAKRTFTVPADINTNAVQFTRSQTGSNTWISKLQITREKAVPEEDLRTVTFNTNGGSSIAAVIVEKGTTVAKPADPTKAHCRFAGWQLSGSDYDFSTAVNSNITLDAVWTQLYTVTFANGGGSGDAPAAVADKAEGETFSVPANTFTAPEGKEFDKWNDGSADYAPGATYTVGSANVTLTAVWKPLVAKYTVIFKDGETELGTKLFDVSNNPSDADINKTKPLFTFAAWQKDEADIALDAAFWATVAKDATVTLTARWAKAYAQSIDMEQFVLDNGKAGNWHAYLDSKGYAYASSNMSLDSLNGDKTKNNYQYLGLKFNKNSENTYVEGNLAAGKLMVVKVGAIGNNTYMKIDGAKVTEPAIVGGVEADSAAAYTYWYYDTDKTFSLFHENGGTSMLKAITITDPFVVTYNGNGGNPATASATFYGTALTLPTATKGSDSFLGWFDAAEGGNKIGEAGDSYIPSASIELFAHWEAVSTDARLASITFSAVGTLAPAFDPEVVNYTYTMPYGTAAVPTITGATSVNANAQDPIIGEAAAAWGDAQTIKGVAQSGDKKTYTITMQIEPKDGVSLIKVATTGGSNKTVTGAYAGDGDVNLSSSTKMDNGKYIGFILDGTTLQAGDRINVHTTTAANTGGSHIIFYDNMTDKNELYETGEIGGLGDNIFTINAAMVGATKAYVYRANNDAAHQWNGYVDYIEVTRAMNPVLTAITIDERAGEIDPLDDKHFNVLIPYEADLAALTVDPTIVWNDAHATTPTTVISHEGAWVLAADGDNTYRLMDKDGDYTDYTITLTRDVLKHTVSFNVHGGSAVDAQLVVDGGNPVAPAEPTKEDYLFQGWAETEDGAIVDVTTFAITAAKEFHAVWASDGGIKLLNGSTVNTTNFITGVTADETVEFQGNTVNYAKFSGTVSNVNGVKDLTRVIAYNATTNKTKIRISVHNNSTSARSILVKGLVEGSNAAVDLATIALGNKEDKISDWIEFNNAANRTIYIFVPSSAGDVYFTQVKVIESGETTLKKAGEVGYSLNFNQGRFFGVKDVTAHFEGMDVEVESSDCQPLNTSVVKLASSSISFDVTEIVKMSVTTNNNKTYYVTRGAAGTSNETAKTGTTDFTLIPGKWFITAGSSNVEITNIAFSEATPDYTRENLNPAYLGTLCWTNDAVLTGGTLYEFAGKDEHNYLAFDEVEENLLVAGNPYIFMPENGNTEIKVYNINNVKLTEDKDPVNNMYGTLTGKTLTQADNADMYYFSSNHIWRVGDFNVDITVPAYYCYVDYKAVLDDEPAPAAAPGRRRVTMGVNGQNTTTGIGEIEASETPMKVMINGQIFIIRGEKMYDVTGKLVK